jgi:hypothetical protein
MLSSRLKMQRERRTPSNIMSALPSGYTYWGFLRCNSFGHKTKDKIHKCVNCVIVLLDAET